MLLHGHVAYTEELPLEQRFRDVLGFEWGDGTAEIMKIDIARQIIGREAVPYK
jgi:cyclohexanecarboxyl-CoA dehydrogenase